MDNNGCEQLEQSEIDGSEVSKILFDWYDLNKRDLPWRGIRDPYKIWISEIILQQTRVNQGLDYYLRFIGRFPDVVALSEAKEEEVLKYWQGLGYYSRARNLHAASKTIADKYKGVFPSEYNLLLGLKGVGEYTAAAIASFSWNKPYPVVDGNVFRFLSRFFAIDEAIDTTKGKKIFTELAGKLLDVSHPGLFNQAIMEFGALQCVPSSPDCNSCPFMVRCLAYSSNEVGKYPVKRNKTKVQTRYLNYFHIHYKEYTYISRREGDGIWKNLYEFPLIESDSPLSFSDLQSNNDFRQWFPSQKTARFRLVFENRKHVLSHRMLYANFYEVFLDEEPVMPASYLKISQSTLDIYPIHRLMQFYLEQL